MPAPARRLPILPLVLFAGLASLAFAPPLAADAPRATVSWQPFGLTVDDVVTIKVSGLWRDGCTPRFAALHRDPPPEEFPELYVPDALPLHVVAHWAVVLEPAGGGCTSAVTPYSTEIVMGRLPEGYNRVLVAVDDTHLVPPEQVVLEVVDIFSGAHTTDMLLHGGRFRATVTWTDYDGNTGHGSRVPGPNQSSGLFSFFTPDNWELLVKVLDGCTVNDRFWVFVAAATSVQYTLRIEDVATGAVWMRSNPLGELSPAHADTGAFDTCEP